MSDAAQNSRQTQVQKGLVTRPSYSFLGDSTTGFYRSATGSVGFATGGVKIVELSSTGLSTTGLTATGVLSGLSLTVTNPVTTANGGTGNSTYTDGQLLIGNTTGSTLTKATLTAGTNVTVTNGSGTITIAATVDVTNVLAATANLTAGNVGTYAWMYYGSNAVTLGGTVAGSALKYSGNTGDSGTSGNNGLIFTGGAVATGTWRAMGSNSSATNTANLFVRIS
jgi:hypothetical protein